MAGRAIVQNQGLYRGKLGRGQHHDFQTFLENLSTDRIVDPTARFSDRFLIQSERRRWGEVAEFVG